MASKLSIFQLNILRGNDITCILLLLLDLSSINLPTIEIAIFLMLIMRKYEVFSFALFRIQNPIILGFLDKLARSMKLLFFFLRHSFWLDGLIIVKILSYLYYRSFSYWLKHFLARSDVLSGSFPTHTSAWIGGFETLKITLITFFCNCIANMQSFRGN